jgi:hypothetical protein
MHDRDAAGGFRRAGLITRIYLGLLSIDGRLRVFDSKDCTGKSASVRPK